jgi:succinate-semialdehyde dehydrogenase/glutarate-semialdehyde dehydrogenase
MPTNPLLKTQAFIDGAWVGTPSLPVFNPATGIEIARVPDLGAAEARQAIEAAHKAFASWSRKLAKERSQIMRRWYDLIMQNADGLAELLTREQGKPLAEAKGEIAYGASFIEFYAEEAKRVYGDIIPSFAKDSRVFVLKQPLGVVAAITPWNFPHAMITRKIAPALAAGCTVVCKPAEDTPLSALALAGLAEQAGFPQGVLNIVTTANPAPVGAELATNPLVRGIAFTGSTEVGRLLMQQAAGTIKKVSLELGGNAPFIVFDDADLDAAVAGAIISKFRNSGQTCVCANRIFVQAGIYDAFAAKLAKAVQQLKTGDGMTPGITQGPLINQAALDKVKTHVADAVQKGAKILTGGKPHAANGDLARGTFFENTILTGVTKDMLLMREETFGPVAPLVKFTDEAEVITLANDTPFGLAGYFYARDIGRIWRVAEALECGMIGVNSGLISSEVVPFGGIKQSGLGREGSRHGIEEYVEMKYVLMGGIIP